MNCKPGILARIIKSCYPQNIQAIVSVVDASDVLDKPAWNCKALQRLRGQRRVCDLLGHIVDTAEVTLDPGEIIVIYDEDLRPLYDGDGVDEVLRYAGLPKEKVDAG